MEDRHLAAVLPRQAERLGSRPALRWKRLGLYSDVSWAEYLEQAQACAGALVDAGIAFGDRVGLLSENRREWLFADMGLLSAGAINVPPHASMSASQVFFQLADAGVQWLFVSTGEQLEKVRQIRRDLPKLRGIVVFDEASAGKDAIPWEGFLQRGRALRDKHQEELARRQQRLGPADLATIMYTSGTTGNPKGVMLSHGNLLSNACAVEEACARGLNAVILGWLPWSHIYGRTVDHYTSLVAGCTLAIAESADTVVRNLAEIEPTHLSCVPRFYEKVLSAITSPDVEQSKARLRALFGRRIEWLGSGGAPLPLAVAHAFERAGLPVLQGYGLTECAPVMSFNRPEFYKLATVGQAIPGVEIAIAPDGEVLTRGPHVMKGYWNNPSATAEAVKKDWLYTGDLGSLDADGFLSITGRKKELLVLSNGKKVVPSHLEGLLAAEPCIDQAVIYGEGRSFLSALIVPNWDKVREALGDTNCLGHEEAATKTPAVLGLLKKRIDAALTPVAGWEQVKKFVVLPRPFTVASEELTISLKLRRNFVLDKYREQLDALYRDA